jgi:hypothetical protein
MIMHTFAIVWVGVILGLMPAQAIRSRRKVQKVRPSRMQAYISTIFGLILMGAITFASDWFSGRTGIQAAKNLPGSARLGAWAAGTFLTCAVVWFGGMLQRKLSQPPADEIVALLLPRSTREQGAFLIVSLIAGTAEEYVMRPPAEGAEGRATRARPIN